MTIILRGLISEGYNPESSIRCSFFWPMKHDSSTTAWLRYAAYDDEHHARLNAQGQ